MAEVAEVEAKRRSAKAEHRKELMDPLLEMKHFMEVKRKSEQEMTGGSTGGSTGGGRGRLYEGAGHSRVRTLYSSLMYIYIMHGYNVYFVTR